jgi:hypothetical protein
MFLFINIHNYLKQKKSLSKMENRKAKQVLSGGLIPVGGERI